MSEVEGQHERVGSAFRVGASWVFVAFVDRFHLRAGLRRRPYAMWLNVHRGRGKRRPCDLPFGRILAKRLAEGLGFWLNWLLLMEL